MANLEPGDYHVEVQASMFPDVWDDDISDDQRFVWQIHVKQPWWRTTGLMMLLGLVLLVLLIINFYYYNRNTRMRDRRNTEEGDIIRKIRFFVERCDSYLNKPLAPVVADVSISSYEVNPLSPEFIDVMMKLLPYVRSHQGRTLTMRNLCVEGNVDIVKLYDLMTGNLHKNPRELNRIIRLRKGAELLLTTDKTVEQIAIESGFYTPNYFIGNFFHEYKQTPMEYRHSHLSKY
jgi:AraC-like DNA-binding protein